jgi:putative transposase
MMDAMRHRWLQEFGGLKTGQVKRLKGLELENSRLRKAVSDLTLDKLILQEAARETSKPRVRGAGEAVTPGEAD